MLGWASAVERQERKAEIRDEECVGGQCDYFDLTCICHALASV